MFFNLFTKSKNLLRKRSRNNDEDVKYPELFFDLIFVFVFTRISQYFYAEQTLDGAAQTAILIMAVWWVWVFMSWATNWLDPSKMPVRILLIVMAFAGLVLSVALPDAFAEKGFYFAIAYVFMQLGRSLFMLYALERDYKKNHKNFLRITLWMCMSAIFWLWGGFSEPSERLYLWAAAVFIEFLGPVLHFRTPLLGRSDIRDWNVEGKHMSERCALFIIIALGETILVMGDSFSEMEWTRHASAAFILAFLNCVAMWWIYFDSGVRHGAKKIDNAPTPGHYARLAYTYIHLPIVAGIIVSSVGFKVLLKDPDGTGTVFSYAAICGGAAFFIVGALLFKKAVTDRFPFSHLIGLAGCLIVAVSGQYYAHTALSISAGIAAVLIVVAAWEFLSAREGNDL